MVEIAAILNLGFAPFRFLFFAPLREIAFLSPNSNWPNTHLHTSLSVVAGHCRIRR